MLPKSKILLPRHCIIRVMATIQRRETLKGISFRVVWRDDSKQKVRTFHTEEQAKDWKGVIEAFNGDQEAAEIRLAQRMDDGRKLSEAYQHYMDRHRGTKKTLQEYESYWRNHVGPALGTLPVRQIRPDDIRALVYTLESRGRAPKTIHNVCGFLSQVLNHAVTMGWAISSPYSAQLLPKNRAIKAERDNFLTIREANMIIDAMRTHNDATRILLATGMRPSELCALDVGDVNLTAQQPSIRVTKAVKQDRVGGDYIGEPKSKRSVRTIGLPPSAVEVLKAWTAGKADNEPLFTQSVGPGNNAEKVRLRRKRIYQTWQRTVEKLRAAGIDEDGTPLPPKLSKKPALYALRHTHASLMLDAGMSIWQLSRHMGHASVSITETTYAHLMPDAHYQAASFAAKAMGGGEVALELQAVT